MGSQRAGHDLATEQQQLIHSALPLDFSVLWVNQFPISNQIHSLSKYLLFRPLSHYSLLHSSINPAVTGRLCFCAILSCWVVSSSLQPHGLYSPPGSSVHGESLGRNTGVGGYALLQGIFSTQGSNPGLLHCRWILYQLSHQGSPEILKWVVLSLLQGIFLTQESNWGLLHCRQILYQLSYRERPTQRLLCAKHVLVSKMLR